MIDTIPFGLANHLEPIPTGLEKRGRLTAPVKAVLFDVYGTLFISESGDIGTAENKSKRSLGLQSLLAGHHIFTPPDEILDRFFDTIRNTHQIMKSRGVDYPEVQIDRIWSQVLEIKDKGRIRRFAVEYELLMNPVYPMPHLSELLDTCRKTGMPMGIISNAQFYTPLLFEWYLESNLEALGFNPDWIFLSYQIGHGKPSPVLYEMAAERLGRVGIHPQSVLYLGNDMLNDIYPAKKIGYQTALFAGDKRSLRLRENDPRCRDIVSDVVITDLGQLVEYLC